jgi:acyl carrier protein phosphodiesterase
MNFLAHVLLSGDDFPLALGNLIADKIKGNELKIYPPSVQRGIFLHREIDHFTDTHPLFKACVTELFPTYRHYSRVIVDMYFDHFLAVLWNRFHPLELSEFSTQFYTKLNTTDIEFSEKTERFIDALITYNWFEQYQTIQGLHSILLQMDKRTRFDSNLANSTTELVEKYSYFQNNFLDFMQDLIRFSKLKTLEL